MTLDCRPYNHTLSGIEKLFLVNNVPDPVQIGLVSLASTVPIIAVAHHFCKLHGYTEQLTARINRLCEFYDIDDVIL